MLVSNDPEIVAYMDEMKKWEETMHKNDYSLQALNKFIFNEFDDARVNGEPKKLVISISIDEDGLITNMTSKRYEHSKIQDNV